MKKSKILLTVLSSVLCFSSVTLGLVINANESNTITKASASGTITAKYNAVEGSWNPFDSFIQGYYTYAIGFTNPDLSPGFTFDGAADGANTNLSPNYTDEFLFNGVPFKDCGVIVSRLHGGGYLSLSVPKSLITSTEEYPLPILATVSSDNSGFGNNNFALISNSSAAMDKNSEAISISRCSISER